MKMNTQTILPFACASMPEGEVAVASRRLRRKDAKAGGDKKK